MGVEYQIEGGSVLYPFIIAAAVIVLDQFIKLQVVGRIVPFGDIVVIKNFFYLTYVENFGIAFGMFKNKTAFFVVSISIISLIVIYFIMKLRNKNVIITSCLALILGGAVGNLIDRVRMGYVVDYLHFTIFPPVFNLADSAIVVGSIALSLYIVLNKNIVL